MIGLEYYRGGAILRKSTCDTEVKTTIFFFLYIEKLLDRPMLERN